MILLIILCTFIWPSNSSVVSESTINEEEVFMDFFLSELENVATNKKEFMQLIDLLLNVENAFFIIVYKIIKYVKRVEDNSDISVIIIEFMDSSKLLIYDKELIYHYNEVYYNVPLTKKRLDFLLKIIYLNTKNDEEKQILLDFIKTALINIPLMNEKIINDEVVTPEKKLHHGRKNRKKKIPISMHEKLTKKSSLNLHKEEKVITNKVPIINNNNKNHNSKNYNKINTYNNVNKIPTQNNYPKKTLPSSLKNTLKPTVNPLINNLRNKKIKLPIKKK